MGVGGLPATLLLRYCSVSAHWLIALRAAASALSFIDKKPRDTGYLQRTLSLVGTGKDTSTSLRQEAASQVEFIRSARLVSCVLSTLSGCHSHFIICALYLH